MLEVLFFGAKWCSPCKGIRPHVQSACNELEINMTYIDADESADFCVARRIDSMPTIIIERDHEEVERINGAISKQDMMMRLRRAKSE